MFMIKIVSVAKKMLQKVRDVLVEACTFRFHGLTSTMLNTMPFFIPHHKNIGAKYSYLNSKIKHQKVRIG